MSNDALLVDLGMKVVDERALTIYRARQSARREVVAGRSRRTRDFVLLSGRDNLSQAVRMRLLTARGELTELGHPEYGSRLPELIGRQLTETTLNLARLYVLEALQQERRIAEIVELAVDDRPEARHLIQIFIRVRPIDDSRVVDLGPFTLDLG